MITPRLIQLLNPKHPDPQAAASALQQAAAPFGITDPRSVAAWVANLAVESGLVPVRENLYYRDPARLCAVWPSKFPSRFAPAGYVCNPQRLANLVYAGKLGNGSEASGDGWRYRGAGFVQTTGRNGFRQTGQLIGLDLEAHPELLEQYGPAALAAAAYWTRLSNADALARAGDIRGTRRAVNGPAMLHADLMLGYYAKALPLVQAASPAPGTVLLVPQGGGDPVPWDGSSRYAGQDLVMLVPQLRLLYPQPGAYTYPGLKIWVRRGGDMVLERDSGRPPNPSIPQ